MAKTSNEGKIKPIIMTAAPLATTIGGGYALMTSGVPLGVALPVASLFAVFTIGAEFAYCIKTNKNEENNAAKTFKINR